MNLLKQVLAKIIAANPDLKDGIGEARVLELWSKAMGEPLNRHAKAVSMKGTTLFVAVEHPVWKKELHSNKSLALKKLNEVLDRELGPGTGIRVQDLFLVSPNPSFSGNPSKSKKPFPR
jgi:hypothetical protein